MKSLLFFAPLFRPHAGRLALALLLSLVTLAAGTALLGVSGWFLTATALTALGVSFNLFAPSAMVRGFSFIRILARYFEKLVGHNATLTLLSDLRRWLFGALFPRLPLADRSLRHGDLVTRMTADIDALDTVFLHEHSRHSRRSRPHDQDAGPRCRPSRRHLARPCARRHRRP